MAWTIERDTRRTMANKSNPATMRRGKGRPARDQASVGRDAMIAATSRLLRRRPPDRITRVELSREAGIDPGLVRYYFGNMASLLTEGMRDIFNDLKSRREVTASDAPLRAKLRQRIGSLIEVLEANPYLHELLMRPVLHVEPGKAEEVEMLRREYTLASVDSFQSIISQAKIKGESVATDALLLYVVVIGLSDFAVRCFQYFEMLSISRDTRAETLSRYADFVTDLLVEGLRPRG